MSSVFGAELGVDGGVGVVGVLVDEGEVRGAQHPVGRGDGSDHPTSGVADEEHLRAALRVSLVSARTVVLLKTVLSSWR